MAGEFIPFLAAVKGAGAGAVPARSFAPISAAGSGGTNPAAKTAPAIATAHAHRDVQIEVKRDGERISQIRIQCRCGELIELDCEY